MYYIIAASILLQLAAAVYALRLIGLTGHRISWILIAVGLAGMVHRRMHTLWMGMLGRGHPDMIFELVGLGVSILVFMGVILIRPVFKQLKEANDKLAASEARFRTVADFTYDWEYWRGPDGEFRYVSPSCLRVTGYPREAFINDPGLLERIVHPEDADVVAAHLSSERGQSGGSDFDFRIIAADGTMHWLGHRCVPVTDAAGTPLGTRASNRLIDTRKNAEENLRRSRRRYRNLVEQAHAIVLELSIDGRIQFMNSFGRDFFGYGEEEIKGRRASELMLTDASAPESVDVSARDEIEVRRRNGSSAWLSLASSLSTDRDGRVIGILVIGIDVTAHKAAEKLREDVERIVRHDLKSPLMGIVGLPAMMLKADNLTARQREMLEVLEEAGMRMMDLINQSLTLYKLESGTYVHRPVPTDWLGMVRQAARGLESHKAFHQSVKISVDGVPATAGDTLVIPGDPTLLYGMVANLIKNALEAAGDSPVLIALTRGDPAVMEIRNSLPVAESVRETFFAKYSTYGKHDGTGLGTYSAHLAVKAHSGAISMETSEDAGTVVRVELPAT
ncbi:MAG: PAS domain-containing sensor histidine kinase [Desulfovibrionaceae bacterium]|nr:PAS domain-containing sensor histidine kinase [Desulfovibrionaceae bacterium]